MRTNVPAQIEHSVGESMAERGWPQKKLFDLPLIYAGDSEVTPFFRCSEVRTRAKGTYLIEGGVGLLHTGFEAEWATKPDRMPKAPGFAMLLHTANLTELNDVRYVTEDQAITVAGYCDRIAFILARMPSSVEELKQMYRIGQLLDRPLGAFAGFSHRPKHAAFMTFLEAMCAV